MKNQRVTQHSYGTRHPVSKLRTVTNESISPFGTLVGGLAVFLVFGVFCYSTMFSLPWESNMGFTQGKVTEVQAGSKLKRNVVYDYSVDSETYTGKETFDFHGWFLKPGDSVDVRFQQHRPTISHIQSGFTLATIFYFLGSLAGFIFTFVGLGELITGRSR